MRLSRPPSSPGRAGCWPTGPAAALKSMLGADWAVAVAWNSWAGFWLLYRVLAQIMLGKVRRVVL